jgi:hypothetical protein
MMYTYKQYGTSALIFEDGKAVCTATFEGGVWKSSFQRQVNETRHPAHPSQGCWQNWGDTLERLCFEMSVRGLGCWYGGRVERVWA